MWSEALSGAAWSFWISFGSSASTPYRPRGTFRLMAVPSQRRSHRAAAEWGGDYSGWGGVAAETIIRQNRRSSQIGSLEGTASGTGAGPTINHADRLARLHPLTL